MAFRERIEVVVDFVTGKASSSVKSFRSDLTQAEGAFGKMQVASGRAKDFITANAGSIATAAGGALVAFGAKSVMAFQETALEAGKFADAAGIAVEDASRWVEVAGDMGVSGDTVATAFNRMNKAAADGKSFEKFGIEIAKTAEGATDANATFLNVVDRLRSMQDPAERAAAGTALLGKGWTELAEVINDPALRSNLAAVSDAKIIDAEEVEKARRLRASMDALNDAVQDVQLALGEALVPALADVADSLMMVKEAADVIPGGLATIAEAAVGVLNPLAGVKSAMDAVGDAATESSELVGKVAASEWEEATERGEGAFGKLADFLTGRASEAFRSFRNSAKSSIDDTSVAWDRFLGKLDDDRAWQSVQQSFADLETAMREAADTSGKTADEQAADAFAVADAQIAAKEAVAAYRGGIEKLPTQWQTKIVALLDEGAYNEAARLLEILTRQSYPRINYNRGGGGGSRYYGAEGGVVTRPTLAMIGEAGPEAVVPLNRAPGASPLPKGAGAGGNVTINVYALGPDQAARAVADAVKQARQKGLL